MLNKRSSIEDEIGNDQLFLDYHNFGLVFS
jgi:hypothetical protein